MKVLFDSNTYQLVSSPKKFPQNANLESAILVYEAILNKEIQLFICETIVTIEQITGNSGVPRHEFFKLREPNLFTVTERIGDDPSKISFEVQIGDNNLAHPGLKPVVSDRLKTAFEIGFKYLSVPRFGGPQTSDFDEFRKYRIELDSLVSEPFPPVVEKTAKVLSEIEKNGYGVNVLRTIAREMQAEYDLPEIPWYNGLEHAESSDAKSKIHRAFSEWADGDTVAAFIGYELDVLCSLDQNKGKVDGSIFSKNGRGWLSRDYGAQILTLNQLASLIGN